MELCDRFRLVSEPRRWLFDSSTEVPGKKMPFWSSNSSSSLWSGCMFIIRPPEVANNGTGRHGRSWVVAFMTAFRATIRFFWTMRKDATRKGIKIPQVSIFPCDFVSWDKSSAIGTHGSAAIADRYGSKVSLRYDFLRRRVIRPAKASTTQLQIRTSSLP